MKTKVRQAIDNYNERVAAHLSYYMGWGYYEVLNLIKLMDDNKEDKKWKL